MKPLSKSQLPTRPLKALEVALLRRLLSAPIKAASAPSIYMTGNTCRAARALLDNLSRERLADLSGVSRDTIINFEDDRRYVRPQTLVKIQDYFHQEGVTFRARDGQLGITYNPDRDRHIRHMIEVA